jgi:hypothetical protein
MGMWTIPKNENTSKFSDEELDEFITKVSAAVKARHMSVPVIMALEMAKPVSFLGYTSLVIFAPILELIFDPVKMEKLQAIFSDRNRIEMLIKSIENLEISEKEKTKEGESSEQN